jgi:hypothetical protein
MRPYAAASVPRGYQTVHSYLLLIMHDDSTEVNPEYDLPWANGDICSFDKNRTSLLKPTINFRSPSNTFNRAKAEPMNMPWLAVHLLHLYSGLITMPIIGQYCRVDTLSSRMFKAPTRNGSNRMSAQALLKPTKTSLSASGGHSVAHSQKVIKKPGLTIKSSLPSSPLPQTFCPL